MCQGTFFVQGGICASTDSIKMTIEFLEQGFFLFPEKDGNIVVTEVCLYVERADAGIEQMDADVEAVRR